jgi:hypothetical protein
MGDMLGRGGAMTDWNSYVCLFCSSDIRSSDEATTVPNLGVLVHSSCYRRETGNLADDTDPNMDDAAA